MKPLPMLMLLACAEPTVETVSIGSAPTVEIAEVAIACPTDGTLITDPIVGAGIISAGISAESESAEYVLSPEGIAVVVGLDGSTLVSCTYADGVDVRLRYLVID